MCVCVCVCERIFFEKNKMHFFFKNFFFYECKLCIVWNWFIAKTIQISQKIFVLRLFKMVAN